MLARILACSPESTSEIHVERLVHESKQRLGVSQAPAYDLRIKLLEEIERNRNNTPIAGNETDNH